METPEGAAFCPACGYALVGDDIGSGEPAVSTEARKVVSALFVDMVGFTSATERADPEEIRTRLTAYHNAVRADVERHGGRVEKLIGDGVFAVFGVPTAHEDDPERAVRAALRIQESAAAMREAGADLNVRVAVATGEAIIQLEDDGGETILGDVVNTASRLEGVAPSGGVVVDSRTYAAARGAIEFTGLDPVVLKGKAEPVQTWQAVRARSRYGSAIEEGDITPFLGRERELSGLIDALARTTDEESMQLVTITGEPGVGKSRLIKEFFRHVDEGREIVFWRQGRCLPYGEGITFWAFGEILKAHAGILDGESAEVATARWAEAIHDLFPDASDATWVQQSLGPLVGLGAAGTGAGGRDELFAAGRAFIEAVAERDPLILVVEDLHWADPALIDFLEHLLTSVSVSPVLLIATARPELYAEYPAWGGGKRNAVSVALTPLSDDLTADLLTSLMADGFGSDEQRELLLERCSGNPLYAIEFSRLTSQGGSPEQLPANIEAVVAARLDLLTEEEKRLLQVASVVGKVFWTKAVEFMSPSGSRDTGAVLRSLTAREMIRPIRRSSMQGQHEFTFWHVLVRDVAYAQLTKAERARLHEAMAGWLEASSPERVADAAELLLHHLEQAIDLGNLEPADRPELFAKAYGFSLAAAERSRQVDAERALRQLRRAVELAAGPRDRGKALVALAEVGYLAGHLDEAGEAAARAASELEEAGDRLGQARAASEQSRIAWVRGDGATADAYSQRAVQLVEDLEPTVEKASIYVAHASQLMLRGRNQEAREFAERTREMAHGLGAAREEASALSVLGAAAEPDDPQAVEWLREGLRINLGEGGSTGRALVAYNNLTSTVQWTEGPVPAAKLIQEAVDLAHQRGHEGAEIWSKMTMLEHLMLEGNLPEAKPLARSLLELDEARGGSQITIGATFQLATIAYWEDDLGRAADFEDVLTGVREIGDVQALAPSLSLASAVVLEAGDVARGRAFAGEFKEATARTPSWRSGYTHWFADGLVEAGDAELVRSIIDDAPIVGPVDESLLLLVHARLDESDGDLAAAIEKLERAVGLADQFGLIIHGARMHLALARCLIASDRSEEAGPHLKQGRDAAAGVGAQRYVRKFDELSATIG